jgi:hypothetical protein
MMQLQALTHTLTPHTHTHMKMHVWSEFFSDVFCRHLDVYLHSVDGLAQPSHFLSRQHCVGFSLRVALYIGCIYVNQVRNVQQL